MNEIRNRKDMHIWVDSDACPKVIKDILFRAADRTRVPATFIANQPARIPRSAYLDTIQVPSGFNEADEKIVQLVQPSHLVITSDIPLASAAIQKGAIVLSPRGKLFTEENIGESLSIRNLLDELRSSGIKTSGPSAFKPADREAFANQLETILSRYSER